MTDTEVIERVNQLLIEEFELEPEQLTREALFRDDLELDSLDAVDMVVELEQAFDFKIRKDEAFKTIRSLGDLHDYVLAKKKELEAA